MVLSSVPGNFALEATIVRKKPDLKVIKAVVNPTHLDQIKDSIRLGKNVPGTVRDSIAKEVAKRDPKNSNIPHSAGTIADWLIEYAKSIIIKNPKKSAVKNLRKAFKTFCD